MHACVCVCIHILQHIVEVRDQLVGVCSLLPPCGSMETVSGHHQMGLDDGTLTC